MVFSGLPLYLADLWSSRCEPEGRRNVAGIGMGMAGSVQSSREVRAFDDLTAQERAEVETFVRPVAVKAATVLFRQDMPQDRMYLLTSGRVGLSTTLTDGSQGLHINVGPGESIGESAPGDSPGYLATVRAIDDVAGYEIELARFRELRRAYATPAFKVLYRLALSLCSAIRNLDSEIASRPTKFTGPTQPPSTGMSGRVHGLSQDCVDFLRRMPFFEAFTNTEINSLCHSMRQWEVAKDQTLLTEGDPAASYFVMARGQVEVTVERGGHLMTLADLGPGRIFGEISLLDQGPRSANCRVLKDAVLLEIGAGEFSRPVPRRVAPLVQAARGRALEPAGRASRAAGGADRQGQPRPLVGSGLVLV
ncbi:MAG: cyclic nucleotide-binding domain-containing protein [Alphaproteobacteria bacterium]|nr:cyclic nucleotide-binding domain-containing protein [Alphaproteobacteria bacterium]